MSYHYYYHEKAATLMIYPIIWFNRLIFILPVCLHDPYTLLKLLRLTLLNLTLYKRLHAARHQTLLIKNVTGKSHLKNNKNTYFSKRTAHAMTFWNTYTIWHSKIHSISRNYYLVRMLSVLYCLMSAISCLHTLYRLFV